MRRWWRSIAALLLLLIHFQEVSADVVDWKERETFKSMPNCDFYKANPGSCNTQSHDTPCRYCRTKTFRGMDTSACPGPESFSPEDQGKKVWVMCAVENLPPGAQMSYDSMYGAGGPMNQQLAANSGLFGLSGTAWGVIFGVFFMLLLVSVVVCLVMRSNNDEDDMY